MKQASHLFLLIFFFLPSILISQNIKKDFNVLSRENLAADSDGDGIPDSQDSFPLIADTSSLQETGLISSPSTILEFGQGGGFNYGKGFLETGAKLIELEIEIGKRWIPLYLSMNALTDAFSDQNDNAKSALTSLFNPIGGLLNAGIQNSKPFKEQGRLGWSYQGALKWVNSNDMDQNSQRNMSGVLGAGIYGTFGARIRDDTGKGWFHLNAMYSIGPGDRLKEVFELEQDINGEFLVFSAEIGIQIDGRLELDVGYRRNIIDNDMLPEFQNGLWQFTFDYTMPE